MIEKEVVEFFTDDPASVYVARLQTSFERLLLHCLCQFLDLRAKSNS